MNPTALPNVAGASFSGTFFRAVHTRHLTTVLAAAHSASILSRFSDGTGGFQTLYLAEDHLTAMFEVGAVFGVPSASSTFFSPPSASFITVPVAFNLNNVLDLTDSVKNSTNLAVLETTAQEITGDWHGYALRGLYGTTFLTTPTTAPTQDLGVAAQSAGFDGILTLSAKVPYRKNVMIFPDNLSTTLGSYSFIDPFTNTPVSVPRLH